ncbi:hypothetical protein J2W97_000810 [Paenibacillus jamilae]|uniref:hypothetical protein n=1 Tax=Paenibacillus polymyxa TaxID=1406 RepID=UPI0015800F4C|nr:hypothetical protein [Paenibacillus polymyxa]MDP9674827.1 hypothetical protein [Paenibacillus jamilae]MBY0023804.1 hypothetical protein [Paenibacillus polymyxa]MBY0056476.1 hypothetical protein [Paenibacillus polymyxa]MBY0071823.1 hypothetical protein [Paenibacillus polymyxa]MBY0080611.1 hypothetical protein [Paenibacillus polymyxa]
MHYPDLSPDLIREFALDILSGNPFGIKQSDLFKNTELLLSDHYLIPEHSIKNALWDISERFSNLVVKKKRSYREVYLYPTAKLREIAPLSDIYKDHYYNEDGQPIFYDEVDTDGDRPLTDLQKLMEERQEREREVRLNLDSFNHKILELSRFIEFSEIFGLISSIQQEGMDELSPNEREAFYKAKFAVEQIKDVRNQIAHLGKLGKGKR